MIATTGTLPYTRYFFDNDKVGKGIMQEKLKVKKTVFLWKKFFEVSGMPSQRVKDFNDIALYCFRNKHNGHTKIEECFSNNKFDSYYL